MKQVTGGRQERRGGEGERMQASPRPALRACVNPPPLLLRLYIFFFFYFHEFKKLQNNF